MCKLHGAFLKMETRARERDNSYREICVQKSFKFSYNVKHLVPGHTDLNKPVAAGFWLSVLTF